MNALETIIKELGVTRHDEIIPGRGEPHKFAFDGTCLQFRRPGVEGEFHLSFKLEHVKPFVPVSCLPAETEGSDCA